MSKLFKIQSEIVCWQDSKIPNNGKTKAFIVQHDRQYKIVISTWRKFIRPLFGRASQSFFRGAGRVSGSV